MADQPSLFPFPDMTRATTATSTLAPPTPTSSPPPESAPFDSKKEKVPEGYAPPCRIRPATSQCLDKNLHEINGMFFPTIGSAMMVMSLAQWRAPTNDATIPLTPEQHREVALQLTDAFKDMSAAKDTADNAYRKRLTPGKKECYSDWAIENCAWHIIYMVKDMHLNGFKIPIYDRKLVDSIGQTQQWTFEQRIKWICLVLKTSKSVAATLLKHEKVWTTLGAPHKLYNSTLVNTESNANRNRWVKDGRARDQAEAGQTSVKRRRTEKGPIVVPVVENSVSAVVIPSVENDTTPAPPILPVTEANLKALTANLNTTKPAQAKDTNVNAPSTPARKKIICLPRNALGRPVLSQELADIPLEQLLKEEALKEEALKASKAQKRNTTKAVTKVTDQERPVRHESIVADTPIGDSSEPMSRDEEEMNVAMTLVGLSAKRAA